VAEETGIRSAAGTSRWKLRDWQLSNVYEIYPVWRHRYAPGVTHNTEHVFGLWCRRHAGALNPREHLATACGCPGARRPTAASRPAMPRPSCNCRRLRAAA
jgi:hypothetical protein